MKLLEAITTLVSQLKKLKQETAHLPEKAELHALITRLLQINEKVAEMLELAPAINSKVAWKKDILMNTGSLNKLNDITDQIKILLDMKPASFTINTNEIIKRIENTMSRTALKISELSQFAVNCQQSFELALALKLYSLSIGDDEHAIFAQFPGSVLLGNISKETVIKVIETNTRVRTEITPQLSEKIEKYLVSSFVPHEEAELNQLLESIRNKISPHLLQEENKAEIEQIDQLTNTQHELQRNELKVLHNKQTQFAHFKNHFEAAIDLERLTASYKNAAEEVEKLTHSLHLKKESLEKAIADHTTKAAQDIRTQLQLLKSTENKREGLSLKIQPAFEALRQDELYKEIKDKTLKARVKDKKPLSSNLLANLDMAIAQPLIKDASKNKVNLFINALNTAIAAESNFNQALLQEENLKNQIKTNKELIEHTEEAKVRELEDIIKALTDATEQKISEIIAKASAENPSLPDQTVQDFIAQSRGEYHELLLAKQALDESASQYQIHQKEFELKEIKLDHLQKALKEAELMRNRLIALTNLDPGSQDLPLYHKIHRLKLHGEMLALKNDTLGKATIMLAERLTLKANSYLIQPENYKTDAQKRAFVEEFKAIAHSQDELMGQHRGYKILINNILLALSGIGLLAIAAKVTYAGITGSKNYFFFSQTHRQALLQQIEECVKAPSLATSA